MHPNAVGKWHIADQRQINFLALRLLCFLEQRFGGDPKFCGAPETTLAIVFSFSRNASVHAGPIDILGVETIAWRPTVAVLQALLQVGWLAVKSADILCSTRPACGPPLPLFGSKRKTTHSAPSPGNHAAQLQPHKSADTCTPVPVPRSEMPAPAPPCRHPAEAP